MKTRNRPRNWMYGAIFVRQPSLLSGFASLWDFAGALNPRYITSGPDADARAIASDWQAIGDDMWEAMGYFEDETGVRTLTADLEEERSSA